MITAILVISLVAFLEQVIGTLDILSTIQRKYVINFIVVFFGVILDMIVLRILVLNYEDLIIFSMIALVYALISAVTSITVIHYNKKFRHYLRRKKISKAQKERWKKLKETEPTNLKEGV